MLAALVLLIAVSPIPIRVAEADAAAAPQAREIAEALSRALAAGGHRAVVDTITECPEPGACRADLGTTGGPERILLLRLFAGPKHTLVLATLHRPSGDPIERQVNLPEDRSRWSGPLSELANGILPPAPPRRSVEVTSPLTGAPAPVAVGKSAGPWWLAGTALALLGTGVALAVIGAQPTPALEARGVLLGPEYDALAPSATPRIAAVVLLGTGITSAIAATVWAALD